eukprot:Gb_36127 [translate_table: standard]
MGIFVLFFTSLSVSAVSVPPQVFPSVIPVPIPVPFCSAISVSFLFHSAVPFAVQFLHSVQPAVSVPFCRARSLSLYSFVPVVNPFDTVDRTQNFQSI